MQSGTPASYRAWSWSWPRHPSQTWATGTHHPSITPHPLLASPAETRKVLEEANHGRLRVLQSTPSQWQKELKEERNREIKALQIVS